MAVGLKLTEKEIENDLPTIICDIIKNEYKKAPEKFLQKVEEKAQKVRLI